jgi:hypothetical protein
MLSPQPIPPALSLPLLSAIGGLPVGAPRFPFAPSVCLCSTRFTAVSRQWMVRSKTAATSFQQTHARARSAHTVISARAYSFDLIFAMS